MGMDLELIPEPRRPRLHIRIFHGAVKRLLETYRYDTLLWRTALAGPWIICFLAFAAAVLGIPTGLGTAADLLLATTAGTLVLALSGNIIALLLALTGLRIPRLFTGALLSVFGFVTLILYFADFELEAAVAVAALTALLGGLGGLALGLLRTGRYASGVLLAAAALLIPLVIPGSGHSGAAPAPVQASAEEVPPVAAGSPAEPGSYSYHDFTYASGKDLHRKEYGGDADLISRSVDASGYISNWPKLRTLFWGFDAGSLPLNARVWMPDGEGPYPLVLMVHGNHMMEDYSDAGYAYLGELLASRGFIAVSLDENFLNYSAWSGIPDSDFEVRTWMILQHLQQIASFAEEPGTPFYNKVDYTRTALLGHSRGGQAVAMAADAARWFKDDPVLAAVQRFKITSVLALAPTDKVIGEQQARLKDVNYLTLQGARDGDVHDFYGDRQYIRSSYSEESDAFKSSLYIAGANHSQFNTDWGLYDQSLPAGLFLSRSQIMDGAEQRQIAKVYVSAFLETTLHGREEYRELFRDYRSGAQWLPDTAYYSRYQSGSFIPVAAYDEDRTRSTVPGGSADAAGVTWVEQTAKDREAKSKATYGILLERTAAQGQEASYSIELNERVTGEIAELNAEGLAFSMANHNIISADDSQADPGPPTEDGAEGAADEDTEISPAPEIEVELTDADNRSARLPLEEVMEVLPLPKTRFTVHPWLEERIGGGKYGDLSEAVFQTYELPFELFLEEEPELDPAEIREVSFYLEGTGDKIMLDDIGFYHDGFVTD
ncbi:chlorophyllase/cutinase-like alpha/beta fold protein [Paenibacillus tengchongensis]|uniref:poly(ethylene terephthalate) hydrolase family protein n=1 Tax=Paenibacillus tengchongensis TaxID=2608684 RepID=UPI00124E87E1|nr:alpha/beta hydrolase [Paenibacillus tengchongensis]